MREVLEGDSAEALIQLALDPHETIAMSIQEEYRGQEWDNADLGLPWEFENLELSVVEDVSDLERLDVREVSPGRFLLRIQATVECEFDAFVHKADAIWLEDLIVHEFNWNDHYLWGGVSRQLRCELDLAVDFSDGTEPELSVLSMQPISR